MISSWPDADQSGTRVVFAHLVHAERLEIAAIQSVPRRLAQGRLFRRQRCGNAIRLNVRFTPKSGHVAGPEECPLCAKSGHV